MESTVLKIVYTFFLGVMLALFVGLGVNTFYPEPDAPNTSSWVKEPTIAEQQAEQARYEAYQNQMELYNRNVAIIATASAVTMLGLSLLLEKRNRVLTNGVILGGLFTLVYGVIRGIMSGDSITSFITVAVGLVVVVFLGLRRFGHRGDEQAPPPPLAAVPAPQPPRRP